MKIIDRGKLKEAKTCLVCGKIFTERKKWKNFEEVKYCSKKCKKNRLQKN
jgi:hypothetical protein